MLIRTITGLAVVLTVALAACGGDDAAETTGATTATPARTVATAGNIERYCEITRQMDAAGDEFFEELEKRNASAEEFQEAERLFVEEHAAQIQEIEKVAPPEIRPEIRMILGAMRERAGLETDVEATDEQVQAAEKEVRAFEKRHCRG